MTRVEVAARALIAGALGCCLVVAYQIAHRTHLAAPMPAMIAPPSRSVETRTDVAVSLLERLGDARYACPGLDAALPAFRKAHWRSMPPPYSRVTGDARRALWLVALTTSATEKNAAPSDATTGWKPELRTWNLAKASFDAREAVLAPPPGEIHFTLRIPVGARFEVAPTALALRAGSITFEIAARPRGGERKVLDALRITAAETPSWHDRTIDLSAYAGLEIDLELRTTTTFQGDPPSALWATPTIVAPGPAPLPYSVLWFVIDTMRPDVLPTWHDDARDAELAHATLPPLEAWLPAMPTVAPHIEALAKEGAAFVDATSGATWTRPGTLGMLAGSRSSELGLDTTPWILPAATIQRFYASSPPLLPPIFRRAGVRAQGFVNNFFLTGYARAGVDPGFVAMVDHRDEMDDTDRIATDAISFLEKHGRERFFAFVNLNSPHNPYEPDPRHLAQVPKPPLGPRDPILRAYLGEIAKDDDAVGRIVGTLDRLGLADTTIVVVTSDHGETLSREHDILLQEIGEKGGSVRFRHANAMYEETTRTPLVLRLPKRISAGLRRTTPVQNLDIAPTLLALEGLPIPPKMRARSLLPWIDGAPDEPDRPIVSEGRAARSVRVGHFRYVERDPIAQRLSSPIDGLRVWPEELYDLHEDPGERHNVVADHPEIAARLRGALADALVTSTSADAKESAALAGSRHVITDTSAPTRLHVRFAGAGRSRRVTMTIRAPEPEPHVAPATFHATAVVADPSSLRVDGQVLEVAMTTLADALVGFDLDVTPGATPLTWDVRFDDAPVDPARFLGGGYGLSWPGLAAGFTDPDARAFATASELPAVDPSTDLGVFVVRDPGGDSGGFTATRDEALGEMKKLLETWGYAKTKGDTK